MSEPIQAIATNNYLLATPIGSGYMETSALEYDGDKISGYSGSAFKAGDEFPQSATDAIEYVTVTSGDINSTITNVSANSGVWGGSALPISAGQGVKLSILNDTLVFSTDETILFSASPTTFISAFTTTEPISNFEKIAIHASILTDGEYLVENHYYDTYGILTTNKLNVGFSYTIDNGWKCWGAAKWHVSDEQNFVIHKAGRLFTGPGSTSLGYNDLIEFSNGSIYKVVGINRKAGV